MVGVLRYFMGSHTFFNNMHEDKFYVYLNNSNAVKPVLLNRTPSLIHLSPSVVFTGNILSPPVSILRSCLCLKLLFLMFQNASFRLPSCMVFVLNIYLKTPRNKIKDIMKVCMERTYKTFILASLKATKLK